MESVLCILCVRVIFAYKLLGWTEITVNNGIIIIQLNNAVCLLTSIIATGN